MRFRTKLIVSYSMVVTVLVTVTAFVFQYYNLRHLEENTQQNLDILSENMSHQLDEIVWPMEFITEFLLSDFKTLSAINSLCRSVRRPSTVSFIAQAKTDLRQSISTYCNDTNFYRVSFFSEVRDIISNNLQVHTIADGTARLDGIPELSRVNKAQGKTVLLPAYPDPWDGRNPVKVFSIMRRVMGNDIDSYIEVQQLESVLENIFNFNRSSVFGVVVIRGGGELFYSSCDDTTNASVLAMFTPDITKITAIGRNNAAAYYSPYTDTYTIVIQNNESQIAAAKDITRVTILMALLIGSASVLVISLLSMRVTAPIEQQLNLLNLQTELATLQAQVNPHFLYNVLNVLSHRGFINGDEVICDICEKLAAMFRYSAGTEQALVTIREEISYAEDYLFLLETRYMSRLSYTVDVAPEVMDALIPKIVVQQLIENAVSHGYNDKGGHMNIRITGWKDVAHWYIAVSDNGSGFDAAKKCELEQKIEEIRGNVKNNRTVKLNLGVGGMGLLNMFARFVMLFGQETSLTFENTGSGAVVTIGARITTNEKEIPHV